MPHIPCLTMELKGAACPDSAGGLMGENVSLPWERPRCLVHFIRPSSVLGMRKDIDKFPED